MFRVFALVLASALAATNISAQNGERKAATVTESKVGDYTFKMMINDQIGQIYQGSRVVGSIYTQNGTQYMNPLVQEPEAAKVKKAYEEWKASRKKEAQSSRSKSAK